MGKAYNPEDYLCQMCAYKSCLHKSKGREILRKKFLEMQKKEDININKEEIFQICKTENKEE
ncbi:MAG: hypothetical protein Q9M89_05235 [Persephonella sp.]|nr:hypothetical protein [Persephonella sp.]